LAGGKAQLFSLQRGLLWLNHQWSLQPSPKARFITEIVMLPAQAENAILNLEIGERMFEQMAFFWYKVFLLICMENLSDDTMCDF
jgi:hypothetical protein